MRTLNCVFFALILLPFGVSAETSTVSKKCFDFLASAATSKNLQIVMKNVTNFEAEKCIDKSKNLIAENQINVETLMALLYLQTKNRIGESEVGYIDVKKNTGGVAFGSSAKPGFGGNSITMGVPIGGNAAAMRVPIGDVGEVKNKFTLEK